ncbi:MAG TPA: type II secretion system protein [Tepidisphaeraceae bacterium]|jgi:prepilin-type N-terminal cleavage/methylation domain-containing protein
MSRGRRAFSLIELLVVIFIIAVLMGILLPVLSKARSASRRTTCRAQLRDIGNLFQLYLNENHLRVPRVNPLPSMQPPLVNAPPIFEVLDRYTKGSRQVWRCPSDQIRQDSGSGVPTGFETYFDREGGSYEYNVFFNAFAYDPFTGVNKVWLDALADSKRVGRPPEKLVVFNDFEPFHGTPGQVGAQNCLFADFHVADRKD